MDVERLESDFLILGSGGAGLFAALHALKADPDLDVTVATKGLLGKCGCTRMVQGGYNVALNPGDSVERRGRLRSHRQHPNAAEYPLRLRRCGDLQNDWKAA